MKCCCVAVAGIFIVAVVEFGATTNYDPLSTDERDEAPDELTGEWPPLNCDDTVQIQLSIGPASLCGDPNRTFLRYESYDEYDATPPWSYTGLNGPKEWHKMDIVLFNTDFDPSVAPSLETKVKRFEPKDDSGAGNQSTYEPTQPGYYGNVPSFIRLGGHLPENFCSNPMPSPIVLDPTTAIVQDSLGEFEYVNMAANYSIQMYFPEDGTDLLSVRAIHAWGLDFGPCVTKGSVVAGDLCLDRLLIHYGTDGKAGAEHEFANRTFAMELQFVFTYQPNRYRVATDFFWIHLTDYLKSGPADKKKVKGKLVQIFSVLVQVVDGAQTEPNFRILAEMARLFWKSNNPKGIRSFSLLDPVFNFAPFFPRSVYYTYKGSLTFPPCFPDLDWVVFEQPLNISREDFEAFLFIPSEFDETGFVAGNSRSVRDIYVQLEDRMVNKDEGSRLQAIQTRKNRPVYKSLPPEDQSKEALYDYYEEVDNESTCIMSISLENVLIWITLTLICRVFA